MAQVWNVEESEIPQAGVSAYEMFEKMGREGGVRVMLVVASNVAVSAPNANVVQRGLAELDFLVVSELFLSETAQFADVVLPSAQWAEEEGTMTNLEGRVLWRKRAQEPPIGVWTDLKMLSEIATRLGQADKFSICESRDVFNELRVATRGGIADYSGITYEKIEAQNGVFWPCPATENDDHTGTPRPFEYSFPTADGRARFQAVDYRPSGEEPDEEFPFYLTTGRVMGHYQSGAQTRRVAELNMANPQPFVEIHPEMAQLQDISEGETVRVVSRRGEAFLVAKFSPTSRHDVLFAPFHWGGKGCANLLTNPALDPISKMPEFKVCACRVEKIESVA